MLELLEVRLDVELLSFYFFIIFNTVGRKDPEG